MSKFNRIKALFLSLLVIFVLGGPTQSAPAKAKTRPTTVSVVLKARNQSAMQNYINETVDPSSPFYHKYLTPGEVSDQYGQPTSKVSAFKKYFQKYRLKTVAYPGNFVLKVTGSPNNVNKAFKVRPSSKNLKNFTAKTSLPKSLSSQVATVVGIYIPVYKSSSPSKKVIQPQTHIEKTDQPVDAASGKQFAKKYGPLKFADHYGLDKLYRQNLTGQGQRVGLIVLSDFHMSDVQKYLAQNGMNTDTSRIHKIYTTEQATTNQDSVSNIMPQTEATLDVQQAASVAPDANIDAYMGISKDDATQADVLFLNAFSQAISDNHDKQLSTSFNIGNEMNKLIVPGLSETSKQYSDAFNLIFEQAALQGITIFNASGDHGPYNSPSKKQNLTIPTSSYVVQVGGTTLPYTRIIKGQKIDVTKERAWGDTYSTPSAKPQIFQGSGGGFAKLNPTPAYQIGISGVNTFRAIDLLKYAGKRGYTLNPSPKVNTGTGSGRNVPDVSANSDGRTGYATFISVNLGKVHHQAWMVAGGTSYAAPQMAAANAVINSGLSEPVGFWNPQIYRFAVEPDTPFTTLDSAKDNNNLYYTGQPGKLYNQATGLGTVNFEKLFNKFNRQS